MRKGFFFSIALFLIAVFFFSFPNIALADACDDCIKEKPFDQCAFVCANRETSGAGRTTPQEGIDFGEVTLPAGLEKLGEGPTAIVTLLNIVLRLLVVAGGIWALLNIIIAGYQFMTAGGDPKQVSSAWARIWQSMVGLILVAGSFLLAAIIGQLLFGSPTAILSPEIFVPK